MLKILDVLYEQKDIRTILPRVAKVGDLFAASLGPGQELPPLS